MKYVIPHGSYGNQLTGLSVIKNVSQPAWNIEKYDSTSRFSLKNLRPATGWFISYSISRLNYGTASLNVR